MLPTNQIHNMAQNYEIFCKYAGITFHKDLGCDQYTGTTGVTEYDNPIIKGKVRWDYNRFYGYLATTHNTDADELHDIILNLSKDNTLGIGIEYVSHKRSTDDDFGMVGRYDFERWLNDQLLKPAGQD